MASRLLLELLGVSQHRRCSAAGRCLGPGLWRGIAQLNRSPAASAVAASPAQTAVGTPYGRQYLPLAASQQLLTAGSSVSITVAAADKSSSTTRIVVINNGGSGAAAARLSGAAQAAAAGTWPALPTWLFGFACGGAAATAMTYNYLNPKHSAVSHPHQTPAAAAVLGQHAAQGLQNSSSFSAHPTTNSSSSSSTHSTAESLRQVSYPGSHRSSSSSGDAGVVSTWLTAGGVWGLLQQLSQLGAGSAHAATNSADPDGRQLPTPWEDITPAAAASVDQSTGSTAAAVRPAACQDAVMMRNSISRAAAAVAPAVVHVVSTGGNGSGSGSSSRDGSSSLMGPHGVFDRPQGSGFIYDARGYILTNAHVIFGTQPVMAGSSTGLAGQQPGSNKRTVLRTRHTNSKAAAAAEAAVSGGSGDRAAVMVHLHDGRVFPGRCVALDAPSDLAVVAIDAPEPLPYAQLGQSRRLHVGEWVVAVGSPFLLKQSVTAGIISCVERKGIELGIISSPRTEFIQTDAAINVGNSGGPLINLDGQVIGINNMKAPAGEGISFAIPIDTVKRLLSEISRHGHVRRPYVGITMAEVTPSRMAQLRVSCKDFPADVAAGIVVTRVTPGSPAAAAGLREDDVIVGVSMAGTPAAPATAVVDSDSADVAAGLTVSSLADALKAALGGSLDLLVVREQHTDKQSSVNDSRKDGSNRYMYANITVKPVEAPHNIAG